MTVLAGGCGIARPDPDSFPSTAEVTSSQQQASRVSVASFGAVGDGVADDRPGIQAALDATARNGGTVFFPAGTYLLLTASMPGDRVLRTYPSQHLQGAGEALSTLKVGPAFGPYVTVLGLATDRLPAGIWGLADLAIDQNSGDGNLLDVKDPLQFPMMALRLGSYEKGSSVTVTGCTIKNSSSLNGLYLYAHTVVVTNCLFSNIGGPIGSPVHDHSSIYTSTVVADGEQKIAGNTFQGVPGSGGARSAIDTHGGRQFVTGNTISGYLRGFNITDLAAIPTTQVTVEENVVSGALIGVEVWTRQQKWGGGIKNLVIRNQRIELDPRPWRLPGISAPLSGIMLNRLSDAPIDGLAIAGNSIHYRDASLGGGIQSAAAIDCSVSGRTIGLSGVSVVGNYIRGAPVEVVSRACGLPDGQVHSNRVAS